MTAAYIPLGKQTFVDANGFPLVGGTVGMYVPGTLIPKDTWQDTGQTILNTNPVVLDARGQAVILGSGAYRQVLTDALGNLIWDTVVYALTGIPGAGGITKITSSNSPYQMQASDGVIFCNASAGPITINLLAASAYGGELSIKKTDSSTNLVTVLPNGSDTIDTGTSQQIGFPNQSITLVSDLVSYWGTI